MSACRDPYKELETYLERAQEEIGKAFEELLQDEAESLPTSEMDAVLPPPPAFRSSRLLCCKSLDRTYEQEKLECGAKSRPELDGIVSDSRTPSHARENNSPFLLQKSFSCPSSELRFSNACNYQEHFNADKNFADRELPFTSIKHPTKKLRPTHSFPEGAIDTFLREKVLSDFDSRHSTVEDQALLYSSKSRLVEHGTSNLDDDYQAQQRLENYEPRYRKSRITAKAFDSLHVTEYTAFPRPPSGDMNLLSIWADKFVLAVDKSMNEELDDSIPTSSPLSENSPCFSKFEEISNFKLNHVRLNTCESNSTIEHNAASYDSGVHDRRQSETNNRSFKLMTPSPDSGISQVFCDTSDDVVDFAKPYETSYCDNGLSLRLKIDLIRSCDDFDINHCITPPPPEFEDKDSGATLFQHNHYNKTKSEFEETLPSKLAEKRDVEIQVDSAVPRAASNVTVVPDDLEMHSMVMHTQEEDVGIPRVDVGEHTTVTNICSVFGTCSYTDHFEPSARNEIFVENGTIEDEAERSTDFTSTKSKALYTNEVINHNLLSESVSNSATLPKYTNRACETERFSCSLPRDTGHFSSGVPLLRRISSSSSAVSSLLQVSVDELAAFMQQVKQSTYHPPPRADICVLAKESSLPSEDCIRDAVTQTTPVVPLSRSSSFTWVTECDCSEWDYLNARSESEDSLLVFTCSASDPEKKVTPGSTAPSSTTDDDKFDVSESTGCSSLYLSACNDATDSHVSDSSHEQMASQSSSAEPLIGPGTLEMPDANDLITNNVKSSSSPETFVDFTEKNSINETLRSAASSSSLGKDHPASFPSTLKSSGKHRASEDGVYRRPPIEANVLIVNELNSKSASAPVLMRPKRTTPPRTKTPLNGSVANAIPKKAAEVQLTTSSHSTKEYNELQAIEACTWLRGAGFPQYAQMYEDNQFPFDISTVQKDHAFLSPDAIQSLFRRLNTLNRCAQMKLSDHIPRDSFRLEDSDEDDQCALSENWEFQRVSKRWSRVPSPTEISEQCTSYIEKNSSPKSDRVTTIPAEEHLAPEEAYCSNRDSISIDEQHHSSPGTSQRSGPRDGNQYLPGPSQRGGRQSPGSSSGSGGASIADSENALEKKLITEKKIQRSGSDRIKEGAKALLRRMESLKGKKKKKPASHTSVGFSFSADGGSYRSLSPSPQFIRNVESPAVIHATASSSSPIKRRGLPYLDIWKKGYVSLEKDVLEYNAYSDSECPAYHGPCKWEDDKKEIVIDDPSTHGAKSISKRADPEWNKKLHSKNASVLKPQIQKKMLSPSKSNQEGAKRGIRPIPHFELPAPLAVFNAACVEGLDKDVMLAGASGSNSEQGNADGSESEIIIISSERRDSSVGESLRRVTSDAPWHSFPEMRSAALKQDSALFVSEFTAPQMLLLRKLSLLKLTTFMEKFSPTSRTGWSWIFPKFFRRNRTPDYKDKAVFGLPLVNVLQRTGNPLPVSIQAAINHLRKTALESSGLFRKSGVRSRIQKLKDLIEKNPEHMNYDDQQPNDVADLIKLYFRELPEALLTSKLSDIFISIFQCIPEMFRVEAIQATVMLMPDENREVLHTLLSFLHEVCEHSGKNQMTATNIGVCFAPSLFHRNSTNRVNSSPLRRKTVGTPDIKELNENRAAYECLACMVLNYKHLNFIILDDYARTRLSSVKFFQPVSISELSELTTGDSHRWQAYTYDCIQSLLKEAREKYKGFGNVIQSNGVELCHKQMNDNHALRLWKVSTEVEAPPTELLNRILRERHVWDTSFVKWRILHTLDNQTEIFQFVCNSVPPHPPCDFCTIRSWRTELPKGACIFIEASINYPDAPLLVEGVRGIILVSKYLIEPCGSGKSRVAHLCRIDTKGRSLDWYNRAFGHLCALNLRKLRDSFTRVCATGRETNV